MRDFSIVVLSLDYFRNTSNLWIFLIVQLMGYFLEFIILFYFCYIIFYLESFEWFIPFYVDWWILCVILLYKFPEELLFLAFIQTIKKYFSIVFILRRIFIKS